MSRPREFDKLIENLKDEKAKHSEEINFGSMKIGDELLGELVDVIIKCKVKTKNLRLYSCDLTASGVKAVIRLFSECPLQLLNLSGNAIGAEGARILAEALRMNETINTLYLSGCGISEEGIIAIADVINRTQIKTLDLSDNHFGNVGSMAVANMLHTNTRLTAFFMSNVGLHISGGQAIAKLLSKNTTLLEFEFRDNYLSEELIKELEDYIARNNEFEAVPFKRVLFRVKEYNSYLDVSKNEIPIGLRCPLTDELMIDPVITEDGRAYEREAILSWLKTHNTSPITKRVISKELSVDRKLLEEAQDFRKKHTRLVKEEGEESGRKEVLFDKV